MMAPSLKHSCLNIIRPIKIGRYSLTLSSIISPGIYIYLLIIIYIISFVDNPLGWGRSIHVDTRYFFVYLIFILSFIFGRFIVVMCWPARFNQLSKHDTPLNHASQKALLFIYAYAIFCTLLIALKAGGFALFAQDKVIFRSTAISLLGGFVSYPATLITPLASLSLYQFFQSKRLLWIILYSISIFFQILNMNRQEILIIIVAPIIFIYFFKRIAFYTITKIFLSCVFIVYILGLLSVIRVGNSEIFSRNMSIIELPFWIVLSDFSYAVRLGHLVADQSGAASLNGSYVFGVFMNVIFPNYEFHGASAIQSMFTHAETAQSIGAPLSYFVDGGLLEVFSLGMIQGFLIQFLFKKAQDGHILSRMAYILNFLTLIWNIRSGTVSFVPIFLYQAGALIFILSPMLRVNNFHRFMLNIITATFLLTITVSLIALAIRI